jgi:mRNA-degrading endonuclease RelE of RelBE toxin-antitoxin system
MNIQQEISMMNFKQTPEFEKDLKRFNKKYLSLPEDLSLFEKVLTLYPKGNSKHFACLINEKSISIYKTRLFCRYLKRESFRIIYALDSGNNIIHFIELYFKGEKENEDEIRIRKFLKSVSIE